MKLFNPAKLIICSALLIPTLPPHNPILAQGASTLFTQPPGSSPIPAPTDQFGAQVTKNTDFLVVAIQTPLVTVGSAYAAGQCIGNMNQWTGMSRKIPGANISGGPDFTTALSIVFIDKSGNSAPMDMIFVSTTIGGYVDHTTCAIPAADTTAIIGSVSVVATDWTANVGTGVSVATKQVNLPLPTTNNILRGVVISRGTPTFATNADFIVKVLSKQD